MMMAGVDARINNAEQNAAVYQDLQNVNGNDAHQQNLHGIKQEAADIAKEVAKGASKELVNKLPGGEIIHGIVGKLRDDGYDAAIEQWNPKPDPQSIQVPSPEAVTSRADLDFINRIREAHENSGKVVSDDVIDQYCRDYGNAYNPLAIAGLATTTTDIDKFARGGLLVQKQGS